MYAEYAVLYTHVVQCSCNPKISARLFWLKICRYLFLYIAIKNNSQQAYLLSPILKMIILAGKTAVLPKNISRKCQTKPVPAKIYKYALMRVNATTQIEITCSELTSLLFKKNIRTIKKRRRDSLHATVSLIFSEIMVPTLFLA